MTTQPAWKQCATCGMSLDLRAPACPRCGAPQVVPGKPASTGGFIWAVVVVMIVLIAIAVFASR